MTEQWRVPMGARNKAIMALQALPVDASAAQLREAVERSMFPDEPAMLGAVAIIGRRFGEKFSALLDISVFQLANIGGEPERWWNDRDSVWRTWEWICERDGAMTDGGPHIYLPGKAASSS